MGVLLRPGLERGGQGGRGEARVGEGRPLPAGVGPGQLIYLHSSVDTNWPDLYLNMITMT